MGEKAKPGYLKTNFVTEDGRAVEGRVTRYTSHSFLQLLSEGASDEPHRTYYDLGCPVRTNGDYAFLTILRIGVVWTQVSELP